MAPGFDMQYFHGSIILQERALRATPKKQIARKAGSNI